MSMHTFLELRPNAEWLYSDIYLSNARAVDRQDSIRMELNRLGMADSLFANCQLSGGDVRRFQSSLIGVKQVSEFHNADDLRSEASRKIAQIRAKYDGKEDAQWFEWFNQLLGSIAVYSDGQEVVFVWGVELKEHERFVPTTVDAVSEVEYKSEPTDAGVMDESGGAKVDPGPVDPRPPIDEVGGGFVKGPVKHYRNDWNRWLLWLLLLLLFLWLLWLLFSCMKCSGAQLDEVSGRVVVNPLPDRLPNLPNDPAPWNPDDVIEDPSTGLPIVQNRWNVAYTNKEMLFSDFAGALDSLISDDEASFIYWDEMIGRVQLEWEGDEPIPLNRIREGLASFQPLIWSERLLSHAQFDISVNRQQSRNQINWHLDHVGWSAIDGVEYGAEIGVGVVDDGFELSQTGLDAYSEFPINLNSRETEVDASRDRTHGTKVASFAMGIPLEPGGFPPDATPTRLVPVQICSGANTQISLSNVIDGFLYSARRGAKVINLSIGTSFPSGLSHENPAIQEEFFSEFRQAMSEEGAFWRHLFESLEQEGVVVVMAAGNQSLPLEWDPMHWSPYPVYVSAGDENDDLAEFSNYRTVADDSLLVVQAPGVQVYGYSVEGEAEAVDGTSFAAPIVASACARLLAIEGDLPPAEVRRRLKALNKFTNRGGHRLWMPDLLRISDYS